MMKFERFLNEKIAVLPTKEFLELCEKNGLLWGGGQEPTKVNIPDGWCIRVVIGRNEILQGTKSGYIERGFEIVQASEFITKNSTIEIFQSGLKVICLKRVDGRVTAKGVAKCNPEDVFDFDKGMSIAFDRMQQDIFKKEDCILKQNVDFMESLKKIHKVTDMTSPKSFFIGGISITDLNAKVPDFVDMSYPKVKKQDSYKVGDLVLFKKNIADNHCIKDTQIHEIEGKVFKISIMRSHDNFKIKEDNETYNYNFDMVEGKVI